MISGVLKKDEFEVPSALAEVRPAADRFLKFLGQVQLEETDLFDLRLCFEESLINAIKYGNRQKREVPVKLEAAYNDREIYLAVEDQGNGFNPGSLKDPTEDDNLETTAGRGIYLIQHLMDRVEFNSKGNRIEMTKIYKGNRRA